MSANMSEYSTNGSFSLEPLEPQSSAFYAASITGPRVPESSTPAAPELIDVDSSDLKKRGRQEEEDDDEKDEEGHGHDSKRQKSVNDNRDTLEHSPVKCNAAQKKRASAAKKPIGATGAPKKRLSEAEQLGVLNLFWDVRDIKETYAGALNPAAAASAIPLEYAPAGTRTARRKATGIDYSDYSDAGRPAGKKTAEKQLSRPARVSKTSAVSRKRPAAKKLAHKQALIEAELDSDLSDPPESEEDEDPIVHPGRRRAPHPYFEDSDEEGDSSYEEPKLAHLDTASFSARQRASEKKKKAQSPARTLGGKKVSLKRASSRTVLTPPKAKRVKATVTFESVGYTNKLTETTVDGPRRRKNVDYSENRGQAKQPTSAEPVETAAQKFAREKEAGFQLMLVREFEQKARVIKWLEEHDIEEESYDLNFKRLVSSAESRYITPQLSPQTPPLETKYTLPAKRFPALSHLEGKDFKRMLHRDDLQQLLLEGDLKGILDTKERQDLSENLKESQQISTMPAHAPIPSFSAANGLELNIKPSGKAIEQLGNDARASPRKFSHRNVDQVVFGGLKFKAWFPSEYPVEVIGAKTSGNDAITVPVMHVCEKCFAYTTVLRESLAHKNFCCEKKIPGVETYNHKGEGIWKVKKLDGASEDFTVSFHWLSLSPR